MRRKLMIILFAAGTVLGFATGFSHVRAHHIDHHRQIIEMCVDAALRAQPSSPAQDPLATPKDPRNSSDSGDSGN